MKYEYILFDLNGTLTDPATGINIHNVKHLHVSGLQLKGIFGKRYFRRVSGVTEEPGKRYGGQQ